MLCIGKVRRSFPDVFLIAEVAELVDALASGASWGNSVEVQVLFSAPFKNNHAPILLGE
jgi:hypothetical protein